MAIKPKLKLRNKLNESTNSSAYVNKLSISDDWKVVCFFWFLAYLHFGIRLNSGLCPALLFI